MAGIEHRDVSEDEAGMRLDRWFKVHYPGLGFGALQKLLRSGQIRVDGGRVKSDTRVQPGQKVRIPPIDVDAKGEDRTGAPSGKELKHSGDAELLSRMLLHEDDKVFVLNKPAGLAVQGGSGLTRHIDKMLEAWTSKKGEKPRLVHRLDRDTSGVLVVARTRGAAQKLTAAFRERDTKKTYWALVSGVPASARAASRHGSSRKRRRTATGCASPSTVRMGPITPCPTTVSSNRRRRTSPGWRWNPIPAGPTSFASTPPISDIRSSAIRNISRPISTGPSPAASRTGCIFMRAISTFRIPPVDD